MSQMSEDDRAAIPAAGPQLVRWLRALADAVERDPALAARIAAEVASPPGPLSIYSAEVHGEGEMVDHRLNSAEFSQNPSDETADTTGSPAQPAPTVPRSRRASKYGAPAVAGRAPELGAGVPDPFAIASATGEEGLQRALETLRAGSLRAIIRTHQLDPKGKLLPNVTEQRMITVILTAVKKAAFPIKAKSGKGSKRV